jgi:hypothetical protein
MRTLDTSEAGLIELVGDAPRWIWAFTCPTPGCDCRTAIVLSTGGDRQTLVARGSPVRDAWLRGESRAKAAAALDGIAAFAIDIDEGCVFPAYGEDPFAPFDLGAHPDASHVVDRIDGEILETLGRLWYRGKGWPDPEERSREAQQIKVEDWKRGDLVAWAEALVGVRQDIFRFDDRVFEAVDLYCVAEGCSCGEVVLDFVPVVPRGAPAPGAVRVDKSGQAFLEPNTRGTASALSSSGRPSRADTPAIASDSHSVRPSCRGSPDGSSARRAVESSGERRRSGATIRVRAGPARNTRSAAE